MYDAAIIGSGPAGISAAINLKLLGKDAVWLASYAVSKKTELAETVNNYLGLPAVTGEKLAAAFKAHYESLGLKPLDKTVAGIYDTGGKFTLVAGDGDIEARSVILCTGVEAKKPVDGEERLLGRGVSYCATCDGFLYKDKTVAVLLYDRRFEHEAEYLISLSKKAYVMPMYRGCTIKSDKAEIIMKAPVKLSGDMRFEKIVFKDGEIPADGIFILKGSVSPSALLRGIEMRDGHVVTDREMRTNVKGVFAAGDCTGRPYQYMKAAGEGNIAAHSAVKYLSENA